MIHHQRDADDCLPPSDFAMDFRLDLTAAGLQHKPSKVVVFWIDGNRIGSVSDLDQEMSIRLIDRQVNLTAAVP